MTTIIAASPTSLSLMKRDAARIPAPSRQPRGKQFCRRGPGQQKQQENSQQKQGAKRDHQPGGTDLLLLPEEQSSRDRKESIQDCQMRAAHDRPGEQNPGRALLERDPAFCRSEDQASAQQEHDPHRIVAERHDPEWRIEQEKQRGQHRPVQRDRAEAKEDEQGAQHPGDGKNIAKTQQHPLCAVRDPEINAHSRVQEETGELGKMPFVNKQSVPLVQTIWNRQVKGLVVAGVSEAAFPKQEAGQCRKENDIKPNDDRSPGLFFLLHITSTCLSKRREIRS